MSVFFGGAFFGGGFFQALASGGFMVMNYYPISDKDPLYPVPEIKNR